MSPLPYRRRRQSPARTGKRLKFRRTEALGLGIPLAQSRRRSPSSIPAPCSLPRDPKEDHEPCWRDHGQWKKPRWAGLAPSGPADAGVVLWAAARTPSVAGGGEMGGSSGGGGG
eukprot:CAMPEP_0206023760 /NCGR_PEP_ID=MMETSP1464-20131121/37024_1 /ASSEMBLY_ACC=CAM_ASM_001124 /TAXON_ID=119497 /ORGANISM="Exanthemachrysis gayraliae, Strain RCC1523" /LENGTH=113 /DNA_ID=CAMNT_0053397757 /DNA_START=104 /DNA_END=441 /DNA_ORIENTATION=-